MLEDRTLPSSANEPILAAASLVKLAANGSISQADAPDSGTRTDVHVNASADVTTLTISIGTTTQSGSIDGPGAVDFYQFLAPVTGQMSLAHDPSAGSGVATVATVYDGNGQVVASDDPQAPGAGVADPSAFGIVAGQAYYVAIRAGDATSTGGYELTFLLPQPLSVSAGITTQSGAIAGPGDVEFYQFTAPITGQMGLYHGPSAGSDVATAVTVSDGNGIVASDSADASGPGIAAPSGFRVFAGQTYFVRVEGADATTAGAFTLAFSLQ